MASTRTGKRPRAGSPRRRRLSPGNSNRGAVNGSRAGCASAPPVDKAAEEGIWRLVQFKDAARSPSAALADGTSEADALGSLLERPASSWKQVADALPASPSMCRPDLPLGDDTRGSFRLQVPQLRLRVQLRHDRELLPQSCRLKCEWRRSRSRARGVAGENSALTVALTILGCTRVHPRVS
jgi:hypothetical protein